MHSFSIIIIIIIFFFSWKVENCFVPVNNDRCLTEKVFIARKSFDRSVQNDLLQGNYLREMTESRLTVTQEVLSQLSGN